MTRSKAKSRPVDFITVVGRLLGELARAGHAPTLVGGMALVALGSTRVTRDFDFLIAEMAREQQTVIQTFYRHGFELASKVDERGEIVRTIDSANVASARLRIDRPKSAFFYSHELGLRVDLLFDFPLPAGDVHSRATRKKVQSYWFHIASRQDLITMKEIAAKDRKLASDLQDLEFLRGLNLGETG